MGLTFEKPTGGLAAELAEVAAAAKELLATLDERRNIALPVGFPKDQLSDLCGSLVQLPFGTAEGSRSLLEYARNRLPNIRREHIRIEIASVAGPESQLTRGTAIDTKLAQLITAVTTAWDEYRRAAALEGEMEAPPEVGVTPLGTTVQRAVAKSKDLDRTLETAQHEVKEISQSGSTTADALQRQLEDVRGISRMGSAEMRMPSVFVSWLRKSTSAIRAYPDLIRVTAAKVRVGIDVAQVAYNRWHEFKHNSVHFIMDEIRKSADAADQVARVLDGKSTAALPTEQSIPRSMPEACLHILSEKGSPMTAGQMYSELENTEYTRKSEARWPAAKPYKRVYTAMIARAQRFGDVINVGGGYWALTKWLTKGDAKKLKASRNTAERKKHADRTRSGMLAASEKGRLIGSPKKLGPEADRNIQRLIAKGDTIRDIARELEVSVSLLQKRYSHLFPKRRRGRIKSIKRT